MGLGALVLWSATIPLARMLSEQLGMMTASSSMLLLGGTIGLGTHALRGTLSSLWQLPRRYLLGCGGLFVGYMGCLYFAVGLAVDRQQVVEVGILNYLWPALTLLFAVWLGNTRVRWAFWPAVLVALVGATLAALRPEARPLRHLLESFRANPWPYPLAIAAALCWSLYSVLSRRWASNSERGAVSLFTFAAGVVLGVARLGAHETSELGLRNGALLLFMALFPVLMAYGMWDRAVRHGHLTLVATASYSAPIVSTLLSWWLLDVELAWTLWLGCALVAVGALGAHRSVLEPPTPPTEVPR